MAPIDVIYENGVFRPLEPVELPEGALGQVITLPNTSTPGGDAQPYQATEGDADSPGERAYRLLMEIAALPHTPPDERNDVGAHHDDILYPKQGKMP
jgi:hypothetical protein